MGNGRDQREREWYSLIRRAARSKRSIGRRDSLTRSVVPSAMVSSKIPSWSGCPSTRCSLRVLFQLTIDGRPDLLLRVAR